MQFLLIFVPLCLLWSASRSLFNRREQKTACAAETVADLENEPQVMQVMLFAALRAGQSASWKAPCDRGRCQSVFGGCCTSLMRDSKDRQIPQMLRQQIRVHWVIWLRPGERIKAPERQHAATFIRHIWCAAHGMGKHPVGLGDLTPVMWKQSRSDPAPGWHVPPRATPEGKAFCWKWTQQAREQPNITARNTADGTLGQSDERKTSTGNKRKSLSATFFSKNGKF